MDAPAVTEAEAIRSPPPAFRCGLCDREAVHKIADVLLLGVATACVDSTTGDPFHTPASVASDLRRDLLEYLALRSQTLPTEDLLDVDAAPDGTPPHPAEIVSDLSEDFAASRRTLLGRVSGWLLSEAREDRIDDVVQELESNGFWLPERRETAAESVLRGLDYRNEFHCAEGFDSEGALERHHTACPFRATRCGNEGCGAIFCASHAGRHEDECTYKVVDCEQGCGESIIRREMDRHCITICPMKIVNCAFYSVGCRSTVPRCTMERHCREYLQFHLVCVLQKTRKMDEPDDELKELASSLETCQSDDELSEALDVRSLTFAIKRQDAKIKKLEAELRENRLREKERRIQEAALSSETPEQNTEGILDEDHSRENKTALCQTPEQNAEGGLDGESGESKTALPPETPQKKAESDLDEGRSRESIAALLPETPEKKADGHIAEDLPQENRAAFDPETPEKYDGDLDEGQSHENKSSLSHGTPEKKAEGDQDKCQTQGNKVALSPETKVEGDLDEVQSRENIVEGEPFEDLAEKKMPVIDHEESPVRKLDGSPKCPQRDEL